MHIGVVLVLRAFILVNIGAIFLFLFIRVFLIFHSASLFSTILVFFVAYVNF